MREPTQQLNKKLQAYKSVEDSFGRKIEIEIIASNPAS